MSKVKVGKGKWNYIAFLYLTLKALRQLMLLCGVCPSVCPFDRLVLSCSCTVSKQVTIFSNLFTSGSDTIPVFPH